MAQSEYGLETKIKTNVKNQMQIRQREDMINKAKKNKKC